MSTWEDRYPPGSFVLTTIAGRTGWWVALAQTLVGIPSRWTHAGIVGYDGVFYEAKPGGVSIGHVRDLLDRPHVVCDAPALEELERRLDRWEELFPDHPMRASRAQVTRMAERSIRSRIVREAAELRGTPYSFADYLALGLHHLLPRARVTARVREYVQDSGRLICSAYVDRVFERAGIHLYDDQRLNGDVTPSDLDGWAYAHGHIVTRTEGV